MQPKRTYPVSRIDLRVGNGTCTIFVSSNADRCFCSEFVQEIQDPIWILPCKSGLRGYLSYFPFALEKIHGLPLKLLVAYDARQRRYTDSFVCQSGFGYVSTQRIKPFCGNPRNPVPNCFRTAIRAYIASGYALISCYQTHTGGKETGAFLGSARGYPPTLLSGKRGSYTLYAGPIFGPRSSQ